MKDDKNGAISKPQMAGEIEVNSGAKCGKMGMSQIPIGWLINRGVWRNPFNLRLLLSISNGNSLYHRTQGCLVFRTTGFYDDRWD